MTPELVSVFCGIFTFVMYMMFFESEQADASILKRLQETKERKFTATGDESEIFKRLEAQNNKEKANLIELLKDSSEYRLAFLELILRRLGLASKIRNLLKVADIKMPIDLFFMMTGGLFFPFLLIALVKNSFLFILIGGMAASAPYMMIKMKISKNLQLFSSYFPDALGLIANSLRAGHSLLSSFQLVANDSPYPINKLFKNVADDISLGRDIREALEDMTNNMPGSEDVKFFITAVLIQKEIGGNLAEILDTLNTTIRERIKLIGLIKTQTSQAKMSGLVLALAPVLITVMVSLINPTYMAPLFNTIQGQAALAAAAGMSSMGYLIIKKITEIRV